MIIGAGLGQKLQRREVAVMPSVSRVTCRISKCGLGRAAGGFCRNFYKNESRRMRKEQKVQRDQQRLHPPPSQSPSQSPSVQQLESRSHHQGRSRSSHARASARSINQSINQPVSQSVIEAIQRRRQRDAGPLTTSPIPQTRRSPAPVTLGIVPIQTTLPQPIQQRRKSTE